MNNRYQSKNIIFSLEKSIENELDIMLSLLFSGKLLNRVEILCNMCKLKRLNMSLDEINEMIRYKDSRDKLKTSLILTLDVIIGICLFVLIYLYPTNILLYFIIILNVVFNVKYVKPIFDEAENSEILFKANNIQNRINRYYLTNEVKLNDLKRDLKTKREDETKFNNKFDITNKILLDSMVNKKSDLTNINKTLADYLLKSLQKDLNSSTNNLDEIMKEVISKANYDDLISL